MSKDFKYPWHRISILFPHGSPLWEGVMFKYWYSVMRFQMTTLMLVRSFRESNLILHLSCLKEAVPLCFALDHIHYSRWLSVFIHDLELLCVENPDMFIVQLNRKQSWGKNIQSRLFGDCI